MQVGPNNLFIFNSVGFLCCICITPTKNLQDQSVKQMRCYYQLIALQGSNLWKKPFHFHEVSQHQNCEKLTTIYYTTQISEPSDPENVVPTFSIQSFLCTQTLSTMLNLSLRRSSIFQNRFSLLRVWHVTCFQCTYYKMSNT